MKNNILAQIDNPVQLEKLYRENNAEFKKQFNEIYPNYKDNLGLQVWNERLNFESDKIALGSKNEILAVIVFILVGGLIANIPNITGINEESFFSKNVALIVFSILSAYFIWRQKINLNKIVPLLERIFIFPFDKKVSSVLNELEKVRTIFEFNSTNKQNVYTGVGNGEGLALGYALAKTNTKSFFLRDIPIKPLSVI